MTLEELQGDLYDINEAKKDIRDLFLSKLKASAEYAGYTESEAPEYIDDFLNDAFDTRDLEQEIQDMEEGQAQRDLDDLRREYYGSVL